MEGFQQVWDSVPNPQTEGLKTYLQFIKKAHPTWIVGEKRLRRVRKDFMQEKGFTFHEGLGDGGVVVPNEMKIGGRDIPTTTHIDSNGKEYVLWLAFDLAMPTGRVFHKDENTGEWVL